MKIMDSNSKLTHCKKLSEYSPKLSAIVAMGRSNEIGFKGDMPWHIPEDLKHFKQVTTGHPVIMGRATWNSLPRRPLPDRLNIVLTRNNKFQECLSAESIENCIALCPEDTEPFIIGGGQVYSMSMPLLSKIYVTRIDADFPEADTYFPKIDNEEWRLTEQSAYYTSKSGLNFRFEIYERSNNK